MATYGTGGSPLAHEETTTSPSGPRRRRVWPVLGVVCVFGSTLVYVNQGPNPSGVGFKVPASLASIKPLEKPLYGDMDAGEIR